MWYKGTYNEQKEQISLHHVDILIKTSGKCQMFLTPQGIGLFFVQNREPQVGPPQTVRGMYTPLLVFIVDSIF